MKLTRPTWKSAVLLAILLLPSSIYLALTNGRHNFVQLQYVGPESPSGDHHTIPEFHLIDQNGNPFSNSNLEGKVYLANFFFSRCPSVCPPMQFNMRRLQERFTEYPDVSFVSFSVDPEYDTPEQLRSYAEELGADLGNWHFLTGSRDEIYNLAARGYLVNVLEDSLAPGGFLHSEYIVIVDKDGHIRSGLDRFDNPRAVYDGTSPSDINELIDDVKVLLAEYRLALKKNQSRE